MPRLLVPALALALFTCDSGATYVGTWAVEEDADSQIELLAGGTCASPQGIVFQYGCTWRERDEGGIEIDIYPTLFNARFEDGRLRVESQDGSGAVSLMRRVE